jgi:hypothetical protein
LPSFTYLYEGNLATLKAQTGFIYDSTETGFLQAHASSVRQHDSVYGTGFQYRGNLTRARRYSVENGVAGSFIETQTGYFITGNPAWIKDGKGDQTFISYDDSFLHYTESPPGYLNVTTVSPNPSTYAYPTKVTVDETPADVVSTVSYNYDFGGVTRTVDPKEYALHGSNPTTMRVNTYDSKGRPDKALIWKDRNKHSQTRFVYSTDHNWIQTWTTVNNLSEETFVLSLLDGVSRERISISEHPGSQGGLKSLYRVFDVMGRVSEWSRPTEVDGNWAPGGDDPAYLASFQTFDWKGRPKTTTNLDGASRTINYTGCGCAGEDVTELIDEVGRKQKIYSDMFGRSIKTEELLSGGGVYRTSTTKYNVRDQVEEVKRIAGSAGALQIATNEFDGHGRLWRRKLPIEGSNSLGTRFTYNNDDTVNTATDPRDVVATYSYNARKLVTGVTFNTNGNPNIAGYGPLGFTYDENGNRLTMNDGAGNTTYHYDSLSQMDWERRYINDLSQNFYIYYKYNLIGQVKEIKDHFDDVVYYNFDKVGRVTSVTGADLETSEQFQFTSSQPASPITYRAWGGIKGLKYGNNVKTNLAYDSAMRINFFEVTDVLRDPGDPDQSSLAMKAEHEYYGDSTLKYVKDHKNSDYDRAFKWDQVGRLEIAYTGEEARGFAGKGPPSDFPGPYRQTYQHDEWDNMTSRVTLFWSKDDTQNTSFTPETGRNPNWGYEPLETLARITTSSTSMTPPASTGRPRIYPVFPKSRKHEMETGTSLITMVLAI